MGTKPSKKVDGKGLGGKFVVTEDALTRDVPVLLVGSLAVHKWELLTNIGPEFGCDYWDCPRKVKHSEKYCAELYPDGHILSYCLECSAFFLAQAVNTLVDMIVSIPVKVEKKGLGHTRG